MMRTLLRSKGTVAWFVLSALTAISWALGTQHGIAAAQDTPASLAIFAVTVFKVRIVGLYFMELRDAPLALRGIFEGYCVFLLALLTVMYLAG